MLLKRTKLTGFLSNNFTTKEIFAIGTLFVVLWAYLFARAGTVFFHHDEIVTKWIYMISWNPFPYQGYVDANNHFLNSLIGGFFIRVFGSDSMIVVRLGSVLSFPILFWSIVGLRPFFSAKVNFYWLLVAVTCSEFLIEYFGMARGYGMSMALLFFTLHQTLVLFHRGGLLRVSLILFAWILAVYANLTLIPFAFLGLFYVATFLWKEGQKKWILIPLVGIIPLIYAVDYLFHLKEIGKLYYGGQDGFFDVTVHSITPYFLNAQNVFIDITLLVLAIVIAAVFLYRLLQSKNLFDPKQVFSIFFILSILNILLQNWILGNNFPEDRAALYLIPFFTGALCFTVDNLKNKWIGYPFILAVFGLFGFQLNLEKFLFFHYEHFDKELITKLPPEVDGIPPSTGARRDWAMDGAMIRKNHLTFSAFQTAGTPADTLQDYILATLKTRPDLINLYHPIHVDLISGLTLFERNAFLPREFISSKKLTIDNSNEFTEFYADELTHPIFLRCTGFFKNMNIFEDDPIMVFSSDDKVSGDLRYYHSIHLIQGCPIDDDGRINFDFTICINKYDETNLVKSYLWNQKQVNYTGEIKIDAYRIKQE